MSPKITLPLNAEFADAATPEEAQRQLDQFREAVLPEMNYGITLYQTPTEPFLVYVLFHETNGDDGYVEAIYATEAAADAACLTAIREAIREGKAVYWDPDTETENVDWDHNWIVNEVEVQA